MEKRLYTTNQASLVLGITERAVRDAIADGRLTAERIGTQWVITAEALGAYQARTQPGGLPPRRGRPKGSPNLKRD